MWTLMLPSEVLNLPTADLCVSLTNLAAYWFPVRKKGRGGNLSSHTVVSWQLQKGHEIYIATGAGV